MLALAAIAVLAVIAWILPWKARIVVFTVGAAAILIASGGSLSHW